jgi:hypothetical protein
MQIPSSKSRICGRCNSNVDSSTLPTGTQSLCLTCWDLYNDNNEIRVYYFGTFGTTNLFRLDNTALKGVVIQTRQDQPYKVMGRPVPNSLVDGIYAPLTDQEKEIAIRLGFEP